MLKARRPPARRCAPELDRSVEGGEYLPVGALGGVVPGNDVADCGSQRQAGLGNVAADKGSRRCGAAPLLRDGAKGARERPAPRGEARRVDRRAVLVQGGVPLAPAAHEERAGLGQHLRRILPGALARPASAPSPLARQEAVPQGPRCSWKRQLVPAVAAPSASGRAAWELQATLQRRRRAQDNPSLAGDDLGNLADRNDEQMPAQKPGPDGERVRSIQARPEPDLLHEADPSLGRVDPEALAATKPVLEPGRSGRTTLAVQNAHQLLGDPVLLSRGVGARSWPTQERLRPRCGTHRVLLARGDRVPR